MTRLRAWAGSQTSACHRTSLTGWVLATRRHLPVTGSLLGTRPHSRPPSRRLSPPLSQPIELEPASCARPEQEREDHPLGAQAAEPRVSPQTSVTVPRARLPPDCPPVSNPSAVTNLWGGRLGAGDSWEAGGVTWGLRWVSLGPRSPRCQSHCLWAQCCCGADAPPPPHAPARAPPRSALGPAYLSSGSHHFCNSPRPREFRSSPRPSPSPPMLQPSAKPDEPLSSVSGATTPSSRPEPQRSLRGPPRVCPYLGTLVHPGWDPEVPTHIPRFSLWGQGSHVLQSRATAYLNSRQLTSLSAIRRPLTLSGQIGPARTGRQKILLLRGHVSLSCLRPQRLRPTGLALFQVQKPSGKALPFWVSVPTVSAPRRPLQLPGWWPRA